MLHSIRNTPARFHRQLDGARFHRQLVGARFLRQLDGGLPLSYFFLSVGVPPDDLFEESENAVDGAAFLFFLGFLVSRLDFC